MDIVEQYQRMYDKAQGLAEKEIREGERDIRITKADRIIRASTTIAVQIADRREKHLLMMIEMFGISYGNGTT